MVVWIEKNYIKNRWMVGWMDRKNDGWTDKKNEWVDKKQMDGQMDKNRWMVVWIDKNILKIDGWLNGQKNNY